MAVVRPFSCVRPAAEHAAEIAALPYDVYNREEAKREVKSHPLSFLAIDRPETGFPDTADHVLRRRSMPTQRIFSNNG